MPTPWPKPLPVRVNEAAGFGPGVAASALRARHTGEVTTPSAVSFFAFW